MLRSPGTAKLFMVDTDVSDVGIGAMLTQATKQGTVLCAFTTSQDVAGLDYVCHHLFSLTLTTILYIIFYAYYTAYYLTD